MEWLSDLAARLPAPRADEPPELRRRIIAEVRDHLQSAFQRELLLTADAGQAQRNVLAQFGDPARLARKLWFDAMWEKIMSQRLIMVALVVVLLASLGSTGLTWFLIDQARQANLAMLDQSRTANQALVEQNQKTNEALLAKMSALGSVAGNAGKSPDWNPLQVRLFAEKQGGAPAREYEVTLHGHVLDTAKDMSLVRTTGADGIADFGLVRPGEHSVSVLAPGGEYMQNRSVKVQPGESNSVEIVCPPLIEETEIEITVDWPAELVGRELWLVCNFLRSPRDFGGQSWRQTTDYGRQYVAIDASGKLIDFDVRAFKGKWNSDSRQFFRPNNHTVFAADHPGVYTLQSRSGTETQCIWIPAKDPVSRLRWPVGTYRAHGYAVGRESENRGDANPNGLLHPQFLGGILTGDDNTPRGDGVVQYLFSAEQQRAMNQAASKQQFASNQPAVRKQTGKAEWLKWHQLQQRGGSAKDVIVIPKYDAVASRLNEWRLPIPEPLANLLKEPIVGDVDESP